MAYSFEQLIAPVSLEEFLRDYHEQRPLLIQGRGAGYYRDVLSLEEVGAHLAHAHITPPGIRLVKEDVEADPEDYTYSVSTASGRTEVMADKDKVFAHFHDGHTIVLLSFERHHANVFNLRQGTELALHANAHANVYLTPRGSHAFAPHWDTHDVFVLQFAGTKQWTVYDSPVVLPSKRFVFDRDEFTRGEPTLSAVLGPGDLLYFPRGFAHEAQCMDDLSAHISLGVSSITYADLALRLLDDLDADPFFRRALPVNWQDVDPSLLQRELARFLSLSDPASVLATLESEYLTTRIADGAGRLSNYVRLPDLGPSTRLERNSGILHDVVSEGNEVVLRFYDKTVSFPATARPCLDAILGATSFRIDELPGDEGLAICKRLVEEGFLSIRDGRENCEARLS